MIYRIYYYIYIYIIYIYMLRRNEQGCGIQVNLSYLGRVDQYTEKEVHDNR